jgi:ribosomal protein S19
VKKFKRVQAHTRVEIMEIGVVCVLCMDLRELTNPRRDKKKKNIKGKMNIKSREAVIGEKDLNQSARVHNGKEYVDVKCTNPRARGRRWKDRVKTRKPCRSGADKSKKKVKTPGKAPTAKK